MTTAGVAADLMSLDDEAPASPPHASGYAPPAPAAAADLLDLAPTAADGGTMAELPAPGQLRPVVVIGPSGVGKGTLIARLMEHHGDRFGFTVRACRLC